MAGPTIDHLISITVLVAALTLTFGIYNNILANALAYQQNYQVVMKCVDLMDTMCLSPGNPPDWGLSNTSLSGFGIQDPTSAGYTLSPFSLMRLRCCEDDNLVYYPRTDTYYANVSLDYGGSMLISADETVDYPTITELMGVNGSYGFHLTVAPALDVTVSQLPASYLVLNVDVSGPGLFLSGATLNYYMFRVVDGEGLFPAMIAESGETQTDSTGSARLEFPSLDDADDSYSFLVYATLGGLTGVGRYSHDIRGELPSFVMQVIHDLDQDVVMLVHSWDVHDFGPPVPNVHYNATFFVLTVDFELVPLQIPNSTGNLNYGSQNYVTTQIPDAVTGFLLVSYRWGAYFGTLVMPWGFGSIESSVSFGGDPHNSGFVATEVRQVMVNNLVYHVKLAAWSINP